MTVTKDKVAPEPTRPEPTSTPASPGPAPTRPLPPLPWAAPQLGLAKRAPSAPEVTSRTGVETTAKSEEELVHDESGEITGTKQTTKSGASAGTGRRTEHESLLSDGRTTTSSESETDVFAGAEAAAKMLSIASRDELKVGIETLARAGAFGSAAQKKSVSNGRLRAGYAAEGEAGAGVEAKLVAQAKVDRTGVIPALEAMIEAGFRAGVWAGGKFNAEAAVGKLVLSVCAEINALVGAEATLEARAFANLREGVGAEFKAEAFAGARAQAAGSVELRLGPAALEAKAEGEASAGAGAALEGKFVITLSGVSAEFGAEAFAGAKASAKGEASFKLMGKKILSAKGKVTVIAGVGGGADGEFTLQAGKLRLSGGIVAALGVGGGASAGFEIDALALSHVVVAQVHELSKSSSDPVIKDKSPDYERKPLADKKLAAVKHKTAYDAVYDSFVAYANKKAMEGKGYSRPVQGHAQVMEDGLQEEGIKRSRVQQIIADCAPLLRAEMPFVETDEGIAQAALDAFAGHLTSIQLQHGAIREWTAAPRAKSAAQREKTQQEERWRAARDGLRSDLDAYCATGLGAGAKGIRADKVQAIVGEHWPRLREAFPRPGEAAQVVDFVAAEMKARYLKAFSVDKDGKVALEVDPEKTAKLKQASEANAARAALRQKLAPPLASYLVKLVADPRGVPTADVIRKAVAQAGGTGDLLEAAATVVNEALDGVASARVRNGGMFLMFDMTRLLELRQQSRSDAAAAARTRLLDGFGAALLAYQEHKTGKGDHGMKAAEVAKRLAELTKKLSDEERADPALDAQLEKAAEDALGDGLLAITIKGAKVLSFVPNHRVMDQAKADRKAFGKARLSPGPEADNQRRQVVAAALRHELAAIGETARMLAEKDPTVKTPQVDLGTVQKIVDKGLKPHLADLRNAVGDAAVATAIENALPWVEGPVVENLKVRSLPARSGFSMLTGARRQAGAAVQQAVLDISKEIRGFRKQPSMDDAQRVLARYADKFRGLEPAQADAMMAGALESGVRARRSERVEAVAVEGGRLTRFVLAGASGTVVR